MCKNKKFFIENKEKTIIESFAKIYNKIKRVDEAIVGIDETSPLNVSDMLLTLDYDNNTTKIEEKHYQNGLDNSRNYEIRTIESDFNFDDTLSIVEELIKKQKWGKIFVRVIVDGEEHNDVIDSIYWRGLNFWLKNIIKEDESNEKTSREVQYGVNPYDEIDIYDEEITFEMYLDTVKNTLRELDSGEILLMVIDGNFTGAASKYEHSSWANVKNYIYKNYKNGFSPEKTANFIRDKWFGV